MQKMHTKLCLKKCTQKTKIKNSVHHRMQDNLNRAHNCNTNPNLVANIYKT